MKLDKMQFAKVIAYVAGCVQRGTIDGTDVIVLDDLIDVLVSETTGKANSYDVDNLIAAMANGKSKVEAIKYYRSLTGFGLKEAKDAVERYWKENNKPLVADGENFYRKEGFE